MKKEKRKEFIQAIFCAPTGAYEDKPYPSRLTDEVFEALAEAGINRIFAFGYDNREETIERTFELCDKYHMKYYPTPYCAGSYSRFIPGKNGQKPFCDYTAEEKAELDKQLVCEIQEMKKHPAFGGVFFQDEAGYMSLDGIAYAKRVFDRHFPEYEFHYNFFSYSIDENIFWGGMCGIAPEKKPFELKGELEINFNNRFCYYDKLVEKLLSQVPFELLSQDKYPFESCWPEMPTTVHVALFELNAYFNAKKKKYGSKFYNYMQVGQFDGSERAMTFAEMALQMHVTAAYGSEGFGYFPGCFPLDFVGKPRFAFGENGGAALFDIYGNKTVYYDWLKTLNKGFFLQIAEDILSCEHLGVTSYGDYRNGFTEEQIEKLPDNEAIFRGELPDMLRYEADIRVESENEVMVSVFEREGKKRYYIINLSTVYENRVLLELPKGDYEVISLQGHENVREKIGMTLEAGCGVYITEM